jgi:putative heme-binding domain-containing protein
MNPHILPGILSVLFTGLAAAAPVPLFDGKTFGGWEGDTGTVWRIEEGALVAGSLEKKQEKNNFLATRRTYGDFDLTLKWKLEGTEGFVNGGVQFRTVRIPNHHEVSGYQADLGAGYDGALYDESRRKKILAKPTPEVLAKAAKPLGEWNDYRIRAEGPRIQLWLNGVQTVDYTELDPQIDRAGIIAVQIHGGATSVVRYKDLQIEELNKGAFRLIPGDTVALAGGANMERTRFHGFLQTQIVASQSGSRIRVRNFGWEGDTVFEQWRDGGTEVSWRQQRDWRRQLGEAGVTAVIAQFGQMESLEGVERLPAFVEAYRRLLAEFAEGGRRVVVVSPVPFERGALPLGRDLSGANASLAAYASAIRSLAEELGFTFVDLAGLPTGLTENGYHLHEMGHRKMAEKIAVGLGLEPIPWEKVEPVRAQVLELERLWFDFWRPMNWAFLAGDRVQVPYSKDWKDNGKRIFPQEMEDFVPLLQQADENVWAALHGGVVKPIGIRSSIPVEPPTLKPQAPEEELASLKVLDGFEVDLFASEADGVVKPIQMRWDERGRLWVACAVSYPQIKPGEKANDYVLVCEDRDGDGRADHFHKYVEGLFMPSGLELGDGGLYVAQGTELLHFRDTDGDGRADQRRLVLGGFGTADSHQMINCLNWGFGGELWFSQGHHIYSRVETPYGVERLNRSGVWRFRPRTGHLDPFFQWSSAGANCWGVVTTPFGQPFHKSGANVGTWYSTPGLVRSTLAVNAEAMNICRAPIKQVGMEFLHSSHFPPEMQGRIVIGGYYANLLEWHELQLVDGIYQTRLLPNLIETKNNVFRPIEVRCGPDGALYVADWYNPIIGHYQASYRHPDRDKSHGRVWRVTHRGRPLVKPAVLAGAEITALLEHLDSPERWEHYQAKRLLWERPPAEVAAALDAWLPGQVANEHRRLLALSVYEGLETPRPDLLKALLRSGDARVRAYATRTLSTWARDGRLDGALELLEAQIADEDPLVRLEAIVAASYLPEPRAAVVAARALDKEFNAYHRHALTKTLHATSGSWVGPVTSGKLDFAKDEHLLFALQNGWVENNPDDLKNLSGAAIAYKPNAASPTVNATIRAQVERHRGDPTRRVLWLKALAAVALPEDLPFLLEQGGTNPEVLAALGTTRAVPPDPVAVLKPLIEAQDASVRREAVRLAGVWKADALTGAVRSIALDPGAELSSRRAAVLALGSLKGTQDDLLGLLQGPSNEALHGAALEALVTANPAAAAKFALARIASGPAAVDRVAPLLQPLLARNEGASALQQALQTPGALPVGGAKLALQALTRLGRAEAKFSQPLMQLAGMNAALPAYTKENISRIVKNAATFGDAAEGKKVYEQAGCIACHIPGAPQSKIGPDLSAVSRGLPIDMLVTEVVWPALNVKEGYEAATVTLKDGSVQTGFRQSESTEGIAIRDLATGAVKTISKSETKSIETGGSVMPEGVVAALNDQQLAHLVKYLSLLGQEQ